MLCGDAGGGLLAEADVAAEAGQVLVAGLGLQLGNAVRPAWAVPARLPSSHARGEGGIGGIREWIDQAPTCVVYKVAVTPWRAPDERRPRKPQRER